MYAGAVFNLRDAIPFASTEHEVFQEFLLIGLESLSKSLLRIECLQVIPLIQARDSFMMVHFFNWQLVRIVCYEEILGLHCSVQILISVLQDLINLLLSHLLVASALTLYFVNLNT